MSTQVILVTGASKGVGRATARALAGEHGCTVIAVSRDEEALAALKAECAIGPGMIEALAVDLTTDGAVDQVVRHLGGRRLHGLVNNAGMLVKREFGTWRAEDAARLFQVNYIVPLMLCQALAGRLDGDPPGHVVNIGSMGGFQGSMKFPGLVAYSSSKAAVANLAECLAEEWKGRGIRANCLALGSVDTEMLQAAFPGYRASTSAAEMGAFTARFVLEGHRQFNGKVLPVAIATP